MYRAPLLVRVRKGVSSGEQLQAMRLLPSSTVQKVLDMAIDALQTPQRTARECSDAMKEICLIQNLFGMSFPKPIIPPLYALPPPSPFQPTPSPFQPTPTDVNPPSCVV
jgi:hypothetical protein